jgi:hypothetical protein
LIHRPRKEQASAWDHITRVTLRELVQARIERNVAIQVPADRRCQKH